MQTRHRWTGIGTAVAAIAALAACVSDPVLDPSPAQGIEAALTVGGGCPNWGCGTNSPVIDSVGFHELNAYADGDGPPTLTSPDAEGFSIAAVNRRGESPRPDPR